MVRPILLAEIRSPVSVSLHRLLRQLGYRIDLVQDDDIAVVRARVGQPSLIFTDSHLLCRSLKLHRQTATIPVIALPGYMEDTLLPVEPEASLTNPIYPSTICDAIEQAVLLQEKRETDGILADLTMCMPSDADALEALNGLLPSWLEICEFNPHQIRQVSLAVREVVANAIEWGHHHNRNLRVRLECKLDEEKITILVRDCGNGFDPANLPHAARHGDSLSHLRVREQLQLREGGFGILMATRLVDHLCYNEAGNECLLIKYLPQRLQPLSNTRYVPLNSTLLIGDDTTSTA